MVAARGSLKAAEDRGRLGQTALRWVIRLLFGLASRRVALVLMGLFVGCLALQTLLPQQGTLPPLQYARWQARYPVLAEGAKTLGLDRISSTRWFWALGFALAGSLALSTGLRAIALLRHGATPRGHELTWETAPSAAPSPRAADLLRRHGYRVASTGDRLEARKGVLGPWGSLLFHAGLVVLFLGVLVSVSSRFKGWVELAPGQLFEEGQGYLAQNAGPFARREAGLAFGVLDIKVVFWPDGTVKDIWAEVAARDGAGDLREGVVGRVREVKIGPSSVTFGSPLGPAALLRYTPAREGQAREGYVHFPTRESTLRNVFTIPGTAAEAEAELEGPWRGVLEGSAPASDLVLQLASQNAEGRVVRYELKPGESASLGGGELEFVGLEPWALFIVRRDRGLPIMVVGALVALAGLAPALFVTPRWLSLEPIGSGWRVVGRTPSAVGSFHQELREIGEALEEDRHD